MNSFFIFNYIFIILHDKRLSMQIMYTFKLRYSSDVKINIMYLSIQHMNLLNH